MLSSISLWAIGCSGCPLGGPLSSSLNVQECGLLHLHILFLQVDVPTRCKDWPLLHAASRMLREGLGVLELAARAGNKADKRAAEGLASRWVWGFPCVHVCVHICAHVCTIQEVGTTVVVTHVVKEELAKVGTTR